MCNKEIKFKAFLDYAMDLGADFIATGHYARRKDFQQQVTMLKGLDANKDQTYFLYTLGQKQLSKTLFPIGELQKPEVRAIADKLGLVNARKKDSTGICFIGERRFSDFLSQYLPAQPGNIETPEGKIIGSHQGLMFHTLGQRKGLFIGGRADSDETPWYVVDKDIPKNVLIVAQGHDHPLLLNNGLIASQLHWVSEVKPSENFKCSAKTRYRQNDVDCQVEFIDNSDQLKVKFSQPQRAITPGQSIVFYRDDCCVGGGIIDQRCHFD